MTPFLSPHLVATPQAHHSSTINQGASPNYFGYQSDSNSFLSESPRHVQNNWSPPSSTVRSTIAASPVVVPVDQNPEFEAFRRQSDNNKSLNITHMGGLKMSIPAARPSIDRTMSIRTPGAHTAPGTKPRSDPKDVPQPAYRAQLETSPTDLSRSPKRTHSSTTLVDTARRGSPAIFSADSGPARKSPRSSPPDELPRFQLPLDNQSGPTGSLIARAATLPSANDSAAELFVAPERLVNLMSARHEQILLLDLRVSTQYASAHISSALNLCIPTTLLKRPAFGVKKLAETFRDEEQRQRFESWAKSNSIVVYDASSSSLKDATTCVNTIKKFRSEGYEGNLYIMKGGFSAFSQRFPSYIETGTRLQEGVESDGPEVAPVVGGCPMPSTDAPANPFFGNIRQNMDLIGGVGQIALQHPSKATNHEEEKYPAWLKVASEDQDKGLNVSNKFEQIERREKKRMEDALSGKVSYETGGSEASDLVQIAGLEKGSKNRYNNIWPFEHSRVKIRGVPSHGCDYFNASHIKASHSNKRYISTQAPVPTTFNDFWNIVWQEDVRVIVMLTAEKEGAQVKAHNYWDQKQYGHLQLSFLSERRASLELTRIHKQQKRPAQLQRHMTASSNPQIPLARLDAKDETSGEQPYVIVRKFTLKHEKHPFAPMREVTQLQYSNWPDFGAPAHPAHLLGLVEQTDAVVRANNQTQAAEPEPPNTRPVLVHCSAGCGRTGTFCTVDSVIDMLKRQRISRAAAEKTPPSTANRTIAKSEHGGFFDTSRSAASDDANVASGAWLHSDDADLIERTVEDFRLQRLSMVQNLRQFVLCYESIMEWVVDQDPITSES
ncbi:phosphotyrosine-specific Ptp2-like protein [Dissoconium aciculare CBS 342.82]|uniref:protein-tyrosine-phosphatase n=1 Tax=Dissoconium aciculare CBS 342.82 TaxID=1314786 RepID=A0A6J3MDX0_9PEZI|nr:phosphotyrosine-specific Ptp2-like protein [Dissoconium aciculare CBS 342.82]KAF1826068.1 phosphotyrosine-specific Ptp2-like protein [Dissoconium aciculare CBS 342.82]